MTINSKSIDALLAVYAEDKKGQDFIYKCLHAFEEYHAAVFQMEMQKHVYSHSAMDRDDFRDMTVSNDKARTSAHNSMLGRVSALNRLARPRWSSSRHCMKRLLQR